MVQITSVSKARSNFSGLIKQIQETKQPVIVVSDSVPSVIIYPYNEEVKRQKEVKQEDWDKEFKQALDEGRRAFDVWLAKKGIDKSTLTEDDVYELVKNA